MQIRSWLHLSLFRDQTLTRWKAVEWKIPDILIYDKKISSMKELLPILEKQVQSGKARCLSSAKK